MSHSRIGPSPMRSGNARIAKQSGVSTCQRVLGTQKCPTPGASCSTQSMSRRRLRSYPAASRIRAATLSVGDFRPRSYADIVACDVPDLAASSACVRPLARRATSSRYARSISGRYPIERIRPSERHGPHTYLSPTIPAGQRLTGGTMNHHSHDVSFHARHDDELLTLDGVAEILRTPVNT